jgi:hydrogenase nickel incorporation protein HypA/HybF
MHETSLVQSILDLATGHAKQHGAVAVRGVTVSIGDRAGVEPDLLELAWNTFRERTLCDGAPLILRRVPGDDLVLERLELEVPDHV